MSLVLDGVTLVHPGGHKALDRMCLSVGAGERIAVIGASGAGKTTLLRLLATSLRPTQGEIELLDTRPWTLGRGELRKLRARIGVVHQAPPLPPRQRAVTAVLAGRLGQWPWWKSIASLIYPQDLDGARAALARFSLEDKLFERCDRLSGGQLQRVAVARTLYQAPELVLADEPVSAVDPVLADQTIRVLNEDARARGATLVASLHAVDLALRWFPRVIGLKDGEVIFDLPPVRISQGLLEDLYSSENAAPPTQDGRPVQFAPARPVARPQCRL